MVLPSALAGVNKVYGAESSRQRLVDYHDDFTHCLSTQPPLKQGLKAWQGELHPELVSQHLTVLPATMTTEITGALHSLG